MLISKRDLTHYFSKKRRPRMVILGNYIKTIHPNFDHTSLIQYYSGLFTNEVELLLNNIIIEFKSDKERKPLPSILLSKFSCCYHNEAVDLLLQYLRDNKIFNVLLLGETFNGDSKTDAIYKFKGYNSSIELLKSKGMEIIRKVLGDEHFLNILLNANVKWKVTNMLLCGGFRVLKFSKRKDSLYITTRRMLHVYAKKLHKQRPIPDDSWSALRLILRSEKIHEQKSKNDPPKRLRKVYKLVKQMVNNHKSNMFEYPYIIDEICGCSYDFSSNFSLATKKRDVITFLFTIIYKIIPVEFFGTKQNRVKIIRYIPILINSTTQYFQPVSNLLHKIKLNRINWLKPRNDVKMTKIEFLRAKRMFCAFLSWFFNSFVSKLIGAFFHVTEASQDNKMLFYRHHVWNKISKRYMSRYFTSHLTNEKDTKNSFESFSKNKDFIGGLCLQPKLNNFRLIVKPFKGNAIDTVAYLTYRKRILKPINQILNKVRLNNSCSSVIDIVNFVYNYKGKLLKRYNNILPTIYAYKFDVKNAYDSLPHSIIDNTIKERLDSYTPKEEIYVQLYREVGKDNFLKSPRSIVVDSIEELNLFKSNSRLPKRKNTTVDLHETFKFTKTEILEFVRRQYRNTCFHTTSRSYFRKLGVYQGFPISGTLFNAVYDSLVVELYEMVHNDEETQVIRLMDDFLILSTKKSNIDIIRKYTARRVEKYNLNINRLKTEVTSSKLTFAGLTINIERLICYKSLKNYNNKPILVSTFAKLYKNLLKYVQLWLRGGSIFDPSSDKCELDGFKRNFFSLLKSIVFKFTNSYRIVKTLDTFNLNEFRYFLMNLIGYIDQKIPLTVINFNFEKFWLSSLKILYHKGILHNTNRHKRSKYI